MSQDIAVPLIPRRVLFGNPDRAMARISPDGRHISYLAPVDGVLNVWVGPVDDIDAAKPVTKDTYRGIRFYLWAYTNEHILYIQDKDGDENWRLYSVSLSSGEIRDLTPMEGVRAEIWHVSLSFPSEVLVGLNNRDPQLYDIYRLDINTGEMSLVQENPGFAAFLADDDYRVRFALQRTPDGGSQILKPTGDGEWEPFLTIAMEDSLTTNPLGFDRVGKVLFMMDSRDRDTAGLFALDPETGERTLLAEDARADVDAFMRHPVEGTVQAAAFTYERKEWQIIDDSIADDLAYLRTVADGDVEVVSRSAPDDQTWVVVYVMDDGPARYYLYDRGQRQARFLFTDRQALEDVALSKMRPVVVQSRDGLDLVCYYTLPLGSDSDGDGRPDEPVPMVLFVHGGPWGRDSWGYDPHHQWLANRGYAVLSVNFRASTGFGKAFVNAGNLEWGAKMHDDLIDAVDWAIAEGLADPDRVAIMGGSYGGYATLAGLTFTPEKFACGVDIVGPSNLVTLLETIPPYWAPQIELFTTRVGDHRTEEGRAFLKERSPLTFAGRICRPLLIGQGANDPRVKQAESDQIVGAMQENGIPVTYVLYPDEGHGFARPENRLSFNAIAEAFLAGRLEGRFEPIGDDFEGSTITAPVGGEGVPGVVEALGDA
jgi:dipeptidyl aminopeptidase/acylaminoacyl peptidase